MSLGKPKVVICRLCLAHTIAHVSLVENQKASNMLEALTSLQIKPNDRISTVMCLKCRLNLGLAHSIQQNMLKAEQRFQERLLPSVIKDNDVVVTLGEEVVPKKDDLVTFIPESYHCDFCGKSFQTRHLLVRHRYHHKRRKCPICGKEITPSNLKAHINSHSSTPQICELCGAVLKTKDNLRQHMFYSHNASRHKCEFCDKAFKKKSTKDAHERKEHLGEANFVCDSCGKKFYTTKTLNIHVKMTHLKLRPYVCDFCNSRFSSSHAMKTHRRQHTNETPYRCEVCGEGFRQRVSLKSHQKSKHNIVEKIICHCTVCGKGFASNVALYTHQRLH